VVTNNFTDRRVSLNLDLDRLNRHRFALLVDDAEAVASQVESGADDDDDPPPRELLLEPGATVLGCVLVFESEEVRVPSCRVPQWLG
jgi:hypothetical protein